MRWSESVVSSMKAPQFAEVGEPECSTQSSELLTTPQVLLGLLHVVGVFFFLEPVHAISDLHNNLLWNTNESLQQCISEL